VRDSGKTVKVRIRSLKGRMGNKMLFRRCQK
jgi:hypothetical protein